MPTPDRVPEAVTPPLVSVVVPTHNRAHFLREAIDSVLAQTYPHYELIVVDDGSTDDTQDVLRSYGDRITNLYQERHNGGSAAALNRAVRASRGTLIALLDDDDVWLPDKLAVQVAAMERDPGLGFLGTSMYITDAAGTVLTRWGKPPEVPETLAGLVEENILGNSSVMIRRRVFDRVGGFDTSLSTTQDYDLWLRLARITRFACLDVVTVKWRMHGANKHKQRVQKLRDRVRILTRYGNLDHLSFGQRRLTMAKLYHDYAGDFEHMGHHGLAAATYARAVLQHPAVGRYYWTGRGTGLGAWRPIRILRPYGRVLACLLKALAPGPAGPLRQARA